MWGRTPKSRAAAPQPTSHRQYIPSQGAGCRTTDPGECKAGFVHTRCLLSQSSGLKTLLQLLQSLPLLLLVFLGAERWELIQLKGWQSAPLSFLLSLSHPLLHSSTLPRGRARQSPILASTWRCDMSWEGSPVNSLGAMMPFRRARRGPGA